MVMISYYITWLLTCALGPSSTLNPGHSFPRPVIALTAIMSPWTYIAFALIFIYSELQNSDRTWCNRKSVRVKCVLTPVELLSPAFIKSQWANRVKLYWSTISIRLSIYLCNWGDGQETYAFCIPGVRGSPIVGNKYGWEFNTDTHFLRPYLQVENHYYC